MVIFIFLKQKFIQAAQPRFHLFIYQLEAYRAQYSH